MISIRVTELPESAKQWQVVWLEFKLKQGYEPCQSTITCQGSEVWMWAATRGWSMSFFIEMMSYQSKNPCQRSPRTSHNQGPCWCPGAREAARDFSFSDNLAGHPSLAEVKYWKSLNLQQRALWMCPGARALSRATSGRVTWQRKLLCQGYSLIWAKMREDW